MPATQKKGAINLPVDCSAGRNSSKSKFVAAGALPGSQLERIKRKDFLPYKKEYFDSSTSAFFAGILKIPVTDSSTRASN